MKWIRRIFAAAFVGGWLVVIVVSLVQEDNNKQRSAGTQPRTTPQPAIPTPVATPPPAESTATKPPAKKKVAERMAAVNAAAVATTDVSVAQLLPLADAKATIDQQVAPEKREGTLVAFQLLASSTNPQLEALWKRWGYNTAADALRYSAYYINTMKYRIDSFSDKRARISLFTVTTWLSPPDLQGQQRKYRQPGVNVVEMRQVNGSWLYVSANDPPQRQQPTFNPDRHYHYAEVVGLWQPYLRGFKTYVPTP